MLGDWVSHPYDTHTENAIKIDWIRAGEVGFFHHGLHHTVSIDWILPTPLTSKILEKNGFVYDGHIIGSDGYDCRSYNLNDSQVWGYLTKDGFEIAFGGHNQPDGIIIKYVHELQHALRLCGLDDLANNFKI